jgi:SAM-dependent methyltransferase
MVKTAPLRILHRLRAVEIETVRGWLPPGSRVLELGGGDGFQADVLEDMGCRVSSIDISPRPGAGTTFHSVEPFDGKRIPFSDATFDVVFSSNVLEHILDLPAMLAELTRVCRPEGYAVHLVPSTAWRFWTNLTHFPWLLAQAMAAGRPRSAKPPSAAHARSRSLSLLSKGLGWAPHGVRGSSWSELYFFSRHHWRRVFEEQGLAILYESDNSLFYTGHTLLSDLPIAARRRLARALGASCHVFVVSSGVKRTY